MIIQTLTRIEWRPVVHARGVRWFLNVTGCRRTELRRFGSYYWERIGRAKAARNGFKDSEFLRTSGTSERIPNG